MHEHRKWLMDAIERVAAGHPLKAWTYDTINTGGHCAQLVRETGEGNLGLGENNWAVANRAHVHRKARGGVVRWAADYEKAATDLGLVKPNRDRRPGDIFYWPYTARDGNAYGHTAMYAGEKGGVEWILENSDAKAPALIARGAKRPLGAGTQVFLTPLAVRGEPRLTAWFTAELRDAERQPIPGASATPAPPLTRVLVNNGLDGEWADLTGKKFTINDAEAVTINATRSGVIHIRYLDRS